MSFDRQIDQLCTHLVVEELLTIDTDRKTVRPLRPISSTQSVIVRVNGEIEAPSFGAVVSASGGGSRSGPFKITSANNTFVVSVHGGPLQTATLPLSSSMQVQTMADLLNTQLTGVFFSQLRNTLQFTSELEGPDSTIYILGATTLGPTVGLSTNREFRGKQVLPGWTLINDPNTLLDRPTRLIVFDSPLKGFQDFFEVNYTTIQQECRRCGGLGVENDWVYGADGQVVEVRDEALLIQEMMKITYTVRGSNPFHAWYGSTLIEQIGSKSAATGLLQTTIAADIQSVFTRWQSIKTQQEQNVGQTLSDEEFPFKLLNVQVTQSTADPTVYFIDATVQNRSFRPIQLTRGLKLPQPTDLLGSTAAQGVFRQSLSNYTLVG